jgi:hypothetical protein
MATTKIKWAVPMSADVSSSITDQVSTMTSQGKTDGAVDKQYFIDGVLCQENLVTAWNEAETQGQRRQVLGSRSWIDQSAAQEFVDFVSQFTPDSVEITA